MAHNDQPSELRGGADSTVLVRSCSRVGLAANPPRARLGNLLRRR